MNCVFAFLCARLCGAFWLQLPPPPRLGCHHITRQRTTAAARRWPLFGGARHQLHDIDSFRLYDNWGKNWKIIIIRCVIAHEALNVIFPFALAENLLHGIFPSMAYARSSWIFPHSSRLSVCVWQFENTIVRDIRRVNHSAFTKIRSVWLSRAFSRYQFHGDCYQFLIALSTLGFT